ncbi:hypothetical protein CVIRNUC_008445 [Coccomyxa viridis]|uniref:Trehalase n=1 Tax=Coccomyxa viridis TaxID=1274662 RepID=A0AAV1IGW3_9CHLO|nr:hypothetical protein CVIRNUC_008445 [Coccomyxa viridis]
MEEIWTHGPLLRYVQLSGRFKDDKDFVDLPLASGPSRQALLRIVESSNDRTICAYPVQDLLDYFAQEPSGVTQHTPVDYKAAPDDFLPHVTHADIRMWAFFVHRRWADLCRKADATACSASSLLPMSGYFFVPGQRFRELYYWDSFWVVKGLLVSSMQESAKVVVSNLIGLLKTYGFVPNGSRSYYLNRSQPPLLSHMVAAVYDNTGDMAFLQSAFSALQLEHKYWTSPPKRLRVTDARQRTPAVHSLARYYAETTEPRPEGYRKDVEAAAGLSGTAAKEKYREIATTAESGWDFSSRWGQKTSHVIPVDLNCFLLMMERNMQRFAKKLGMPDKEEDYGLAAHKREVAIRELMTVPSRPGVWTDLVIAGPVDSFKIGASCVYKVEQRHSAGSYASDYLPIWAGLAASPEAAFAGVCEMHRAGLVHEGGIATSDRKDTGEQWDGSNAWPPLQAMIIEGLQEHGGPQGQECARMLAQQWLASNFRGWLKHGQMFEKLDAERPGEPGGQGEYCVQTGFGWSNGVVLQLLATYGWHPELLEQPRPWVK